MASYETIVRRRANDKLTVPTRIACYGMLPQVLESLRKDIPELNEAAIVIRFLIEYVAAIPPKGLRPMSLGVHDRLVVIASEIVHWGRISDLIHYELSDSEISLLPSGRLGVGEHLYETALEQFLGAYTAAEVDRNSRRFGHYWHRAPSGLQPAEVLAIEAATEAEFGVSLDGLSAFLTEAINLGDTIPGEPKVESEERFIGDLTTRLSWSREKAERALELFVLRQRDGFLNPPQGFSKADVYPWRFNRDLSYLRRPLVLRAGRHGAEVLWGQRHTYEAVINLLGLCIDGRLKARSPEMKRLIREAQNEEAEAFNDKVAALYWGRHETITRVRVHKIAGEKLRDEVGRDLGDIDVLAAVPAERRILAIETKDLAVARTPAELHNELESTFETRGGRSAAVDRHLRRVEWVRQHLGSTLAWLGLDSGKAHEWAVEPLLVLSAELVSPYLVRSAVPALSYRELSLQLNEDSCRSATLRLD